MRQFCFLTALISTIALHTFAGNVTTSGIRTSRYGITPYPEPVGFHHSIYTMNTYFPLTVPAAIWTIGEFWDPDECHLNFPNDNGYPTDYFSYESEDLSEEYLSYFDDNGIKVYLQVEPGASDMEDLIDMVLERYGDHECVIGFGVDVEWYQCVDNIWGKKVTDAVAEEWEGWVKAHGSSYNLFLKHPDRTPTRFPDTYRGDLIFVNDCEGLDTIEPAGTKGFADYENDFLGVMKTFAEHFNPNTIFYQIGYPSIEVLWQDFDPKPKVMGRDLAGVCGSGQDVGIFWVDFGMEGVLPHDDNWVAQDWPTPIIWNNSGKQVTNAFSLNPHQKCNLNIFSLNGKLLHSIYGFGDEIAPLLSRHYGTTGDINGMVIYQVEQGERSFVRKVGGVR